MTLPREIFEIDDIDVFEVLNSPIRQTIMRHLHAPRSVKELAARMDVPPTRLYYHVNLLADREIIKVVEERKAGALIEKVYQTVARTFRPSQKLLESGSDPDEMARITAAVVLDQARVDAESGLAEYFRVGEEAARHGAIGRGRSVMTEAGAEKFAQRLNDLLDQMGDDDPGDDGVEYALSIVFFPATVKR